jgi:GAF domain-containing protein
VTPAGADFLGDDPILEALSARRVTRDAILRRVAGAQRSSAMMLRNNGRERAARTAERAALRIRLTLDEPKAAQRMLSAARLVRETPQGELRMKRALNGAMALLGARKGNIQLADDGSKELRIAVQDGFGEEFLRHFALVADDSSACGRAVSLHAQVVVGDVDADDGFEPHRRIAAASGFRAVQSTPLVGRDGGLVGILSTHFQEPHHPTARDLLLIGWYADEIGAAVAAAR